MVNKKNIIKTAIFSVFVGLTILPLQAAGWEQFKKPVAGKPNAIGKYTNGCLIGAQALPFDGEGYQIVRREKLRYFAHPEMYSYLIDLGHKIHKSHLPEMLVSDIAMPAGGRFASGGHSSHQLGLDVDIWFKMGKLTQAQAQHSTGLARYMVNESNHTMTRDWGRSQAKLLELAAKDPRVARIFVNPMVKIKLCETLPKAQRGWLHKVRPWFGHNDHFHVRLNCPKGSPYCENQAAVPAGDGCNATLYSWLEPKRPSHKVHKAIIPPPPVLCQMLLDKHKS